MLLLIPTVILVLVICYLYGILPYVLFKTPLPINLFTPVLLGFAVLGILSQWCMLVGAINEVSVMAVCLGALLAYWVYAKTYHQHLKAIRNWVVSLSPIYTIAIALLFVLLLYQSALPTKIQDMAAYYLQTIQWMQKFGVVKGLGNIYPALGLGSAWHSLLCLFQIPGFPPFYGLNAAIIFTVFVWIVFQLKLNHTQEEKPQTTVTTAYLLAYALGLFTISFLYLTAPSPDLPLLVFTPLLVYFAWVERDAIPSSFTLLLACFLYAIKPPALVGIAIGTFTVWQQLKRKPWALQLGSHLLIAILCLTPIVSKNFIQTGYALYPAGEIGIEAYIGKWMEEPNSANASVPSWKIPTDWNKAYRKGIVVWGYTDSIPAAVFKDNLPQSSQRFYTWLSRPGYKGFMNTLLFVNFILACLLCLSIRLPQVKWVYGALIPLSIIEWFYLTQYRLMLPLGLSLFCMNTYTIFTAWPRAAKLLRTLAWERYCIAFTLVLYSFLCLVPMSAFRQASRNKSITKTDGFTTSYLLEPYHKYAEGSLDSTQINIGYIHFYKDKNYSWNAPIPAVSASHTRFLSTHFGYQLQGFGPSLKDGFYLKKISN